MLLAASLGREPRMDHVCTCRHLRVYLSVRDAEWEYLGMTATLFFPAFA
jgi:hypothetical protein